MRHPSACPPPRCAGSVAAAALCIQAVPASPRFPPATPPRCHCAAGALADRYGGKGVLAAGVAAWSVTTVLTPPAAALGVPALIAMRCVALALRSGRAGPLSLRPGLRARLLAALSTHPAGCALQHHTLAALDLARTPLPPSLPSPLPRLQHRHGPGRGGGLPRHPLHHRPLGPGGAAGDVCGHRDGGQLCGHSPGLWAGPHHHRGAGLAGERLPGPARLPEMPAQLQAGGWRGCSQGSANPMALSPLAAPHISPLHASSRLHTCSGCFTFSAPRPCCGCPSGCRSASTAATSGAAAAASPSACLSCLPAAMQATLRRRLTARAARAAHAAPAPAEMRQRRRGCSVLAQHCQTILVSVGSEWSPAIISLPAMPRRWPSYAHALCQLACGCCLLTPVARPHPLSAHPSSLEQPARRAPTGQTASRSATARSSSAAASALQRSYASQRSGPSAPRSTRVRPRWGAGVCWASDHQRGRGGAWVAGRSSTAPAMPSLGTRARAVVGQESHQWLHHPRPCRSPATLLARSAGSWGFYGLLNWLPTFFRDVYHVEISQLASFTLAPYIVQGSVGLFSGGWVEAGTRGNGGLQAGCRELAAAGAWRCAAWPRKGHTCAHRSACAAARLAGLCPRTPLAHARCRRAC